MTVQKKGIYYYLMWILLIFNFTFSLIAIESLKTLAMHGMLMSNYADTLRAIMTITFELYFLAEIFRVKEGYTIISTTQYKLFKCRESGKEETFMMFADSEEELETFFEYSQPNKRFFIEAAEITGKSIQLKIFNEPSKL